MRNLRVDRLVRNAAALIISGGGSAVLGVAFWSMATRTVSAANIGKSSAEITAMMLIATLAQLGLPPMFERFLPISGNRAQGLVIRAYGMCVLASLVLGVAYMGLGLSNDFLPPGAIWHVVFVGSIALWTIFALQDSVLIGLRASVWVPVENISYSVAKLGFIPVFVYWGKSNAIFSAWMAPLLFAILGVNWYLFKVRIPRHEVLVLSNEKFPTWRELASMTSAQYASQIVNAIAPLVIVLLIFRRLGAVSSAYYYIPTQITSGVSLFLISIVRSFLVEASTEPLELRRHTQVALRSGIVVVLLSVGAGVIAAPQILQIFGPTYPEHGTTLMRLMLLSLLGFSITDFYSALVWIERKVWAIVMRELVLTLLYFGIVLSTISRFGILSVGIASISTSSLQIVVFLGPLIRRYRKIKSNASRVS